MIEYQHAGLQRDHHALARCHPVAARADDVLGVQEQDDLFAQAREFVVRVDGEERQRFQRIAPQRIGYRLRFEDALLLPAA